VRHLDVLPPNELTSRIGGAETDYAQIAASQAAWLVEMLPREWSWEGKRVLDFGCGTGRTMVRLHGEAETAELWGCDIDAPSISWAESHLSPPLNFVVNDELPPVPLESGTFDLAYGFSVFTHLVSTWTDWLLEMHRLLRVGGLGVFSFLGPGMIREVAGRDWDERMGMIGLDVGKPWSVGGPNVLHSEWWLREHWGRAFDVRAIRPATDVAKPQGHGFILLEKTSSDAPSRAELSRIDYTDRREIASLELAVEILQERSAALWKAASGTIIVETDDLRAEVEQLRHQLAAIAGSSTWRLTRPLRDTVTKIRGSR
jgi:SAM-dependent methyltransferase